MSSELPLRVAARAPLAAAAFAWRQAHVLAVTVVARASYALQPDGRLLPAMAEPPDGADRYYGGDPSRPLREPSDLVPYRDCGDLLFAGRAHALAGARVRLALLRQGNAYLDRILAAEPELDGAGMGPLAPYAPERACFLRGGERPERVAHVVALAAELDRRYFQTAPLAQRFAVLLPGDQLFLEGLHPQAGLVLATLPVTQPEVVALLGQASHRVGMRCDQLFVDTDLGRCTLTWRGSFSMPDERALSDVAMRAWVQDLPTPVIGERAPVAASQPAPSGVPPEWGGASAGGAAFAAALKRKIARGARLTPPPIAGSGIPAASGLPARSGAPGATTPPGPRSGEDR